MLPAGQPVASPARVFDSPGLTRLLGASGYDCILFDCPPLLEAPETEVLLRQTDAFILVVEAERTRWEVVQRAMRIAKRADAQLLGTVLNKRKRHIPESVYRLL